MLVNDVDWELRCVVLRRAVASIAKVTCCWLAPCYEWQAVLVIAVAHGMPWLSCLATRYCCSGQLESELSDQDDVTFISTLHGG